MNILMNAHNVYPPKLSVCGCVSITHKKTNFLKTKLQLLRIADVYRCFYSFVSEAGFIPKIIKPDNVVSVFSLIKFLRFYNTQKGKRSKW